MGVSGGGLENESGEKVTFILAHENWYNFQGSLEWNKKCITEENTEQKPRGWKAEPTFRKVCSDAQKCSGYIEEWGTIGHKTPKLDWHNIKTGLAMRLSLDLFLWL